MPVIFGSPVNAVAGSHVDEVLQACTVSRYLLRVVRLDRGEDALLGRGDLYLQLLKHVGPSPSVPSASFRVRASRMARRGA
jgi:hypothetical protein